MKGLICITLITLCLALTFSYNPVIDIFVSKLFFSTTDNDFLMKENIVLLIMDKSAYVIAFLLVSFNAVLILKRLLQTYSLNLKLYRKEVFVLLVFLVGSVVLVQGFSKHYFGRARPAQIEEFGGKLEFTPAFQISKQCKVNCSFVSFHTSVGILLISYAIVLSRKKRVLFTMLGIFLTLLFGITRIMQGKHFLSDIVFSICFMLIVVRTLSLLLKMYTTNTEDNYS